MLSSKGNILCLLEILRRYSDEEHILTADEIISKMNSVYNMQIERRALYSNINILCDFGYDLSTYTENGKGYFLREREFEPSEVHLLADAVYSSSFIPEKATRDLIKKLQNTQSVHFSHRIGSTTCIKPEVKSTNKALFYNIEVLDNAISEGCQVEFSYLKYNLKKELVPRRHEKYKVSPYAIVWANEKYYLICHYEKYGSISHFRIDKISGISLCLDRAVPRKKDFSPYTYAKTAIYMYGGEVETVELICDLTILDDVIDRFGKDIRITETDDTHFKVTINASKTGITFWALQYLKHCRVIAPESLRMEIKEIITQGLEGYSHHNT